MRTAHTEARNYYISNTGSDAADGSLSKPFKTINKLNSIHLKAGDSVFFKSKEIFAGSIEIDSTDSGNVQSVIHIGSYGDGKAIIDGGEGTALNLCNTQHLNVSNLVFKGAGRKNGNVKDGVVIKNCKNIVIDSIEAKGFQKAGILLYASKNVILKKAVSSENGYAGISIAADSGKLDCSDILVQDCIAENNPGDPANLKNHSGNGIVAAYCSNVLIEYCVATNNGWDMPRKGNGPVGIWCYEADSVIIQHCISYKNKTSPGAGDGGGFDLDGGVTNSLIQYCLSYDNYGSGYGLFQYTSASNWYNNTIRFCISENDGAISSAGASVFFSNSTDDANQFKDLFFYNNTIYNTKSAAMCYEVQSAHKGFRFYNNIFVAKDTLVIGKETDSRYLGNNWYSLRPGFIPFKSAHDKAIAETNIKPVFTRAGSADIRLPRQLKIFNNYHLQQNSALKNRGLNLKEAFKIEVGRKSFNSDNILGVGACL